MDYLDNKIQYPKVSKVEVRQPSYSFHRQLCYLSLFHLSFFSVSLFLSRKDLVRKTSLIKDFYSTYFPLYSFTFLAYPLDSLIWDSLNSQIRFYQTIVFAKPEVKA